MSADLRTYRALVHAEQNLALGLPAQYAIANAADEQAIDAGALALLVLAKHLACARAKAELSAQQQHDAAVEDGTSKEPVPPRDGRRVMSAEARARVTEGLRKHWAERRAQADVARAGRRRAA